MNFKAKRINKTKKKTVLEVSKNITEKKSSSKKFSMPDFKKLLSFKKTLATLIILLLLTISAFAVYKSSSAKQVIAKTILKTIGSDLLKDKDGYTNILAVGVGGEGHSGGDLTDTIIVASINEKTDKVVISSVPRDLYVKHENIISQRINSVYENTEYRLGEGQGMETLADIAGEFLGVDIHYYLKIDFKGLVDVVDAVGGVEVYNETAIYDPYYPGPNYSFQTFSLPQGMQYLDGEKALKFSRSRKTSSDFDRSKRQQQVIFAIKEKALQLNILSSPENLQNLYDSIESNLQTNLTFREITSLASVASSINRSDLVSVVISDDFNNKGGFLYTPPRSLYGDAFVLLPADTSLSQIHTFIQLHRQFPDLMQNPITIDVINGTNTNGLAGKTASILTRFGFNINQVKNTEDETLVFPESEIETSIGKDAEIIEALQMLFKPIQKITYTDPQLPDPSSDGLPSGVKVIAGEDLVDTLKFYDVYSSLAPIIQQAIDENRAANNPEIEEEIEPKSDLTLTPLTETNIDLNIN
jgi:LCP family protein required for cell wall assembly